MREKDADRSRYDIKYLPFKIKGCILILLFPYCRWVFLFDKVILFTTRKFKFGTGIRYAVKAFHSVNELRVENHSAVKGRVR